MNRWMLGVALAVSAAVFASVAGAAEPAPVRQQQDGFGAGYYFREDGGAGCLERVAFIAATDYVVERASTELEAAREVIGGVHEYNWCTDTFLVTAGGPLTLDDISVAPSLQDAHLQAHGTWVNSQDGDDLSVEVDLTLVATAQVRGGANPPPRVDCTTTTGIVFPCSRSFVTGGGHATGTFVVDGTEYVVPPDTPYPFGAISATAGVARYQVTCVLPDGVDFHECQLIQVNP